MLPPADPPASLPRVRQHRRHPQDGTESKLIYKKKREKKKFTENFRTEKRCQDAEEEKRGHEGQRAWREGPGSGEPWITAVFTSGVRRGRLVLGALQSGEQS